MTYAYGYSTSGWGDLLTTFKGRSITYDAVGNPLSYYSGTQYSFVWTGRSLTGATIGTNEYDFTYNEAGIRTSKTKNGVTTTYYLNGSQILGEETNGNITVYLYDAEGTPIGMQYHGATYAENVWDVFWYEKNIQGDIVAVYNQAGTKLISYTYDAWGNFITTYHNGTSSSSIAAKNPFTYRGYYYDADLSLYYLNTRYYDSIVGRFVSADNSNVLSATPDQLTDKNLYAYCDNNPVMRSDNGGEFWHIVVGAVVGAVVNGAISVATQLATKGTVNWGSVGISAGAGAVTGALASTGFGPAVQILSNAAVSAAESILTQGVEKGFSEIDYTDATLDAVIGGFSARNSGLNKGNAKNLMREGLNTIKNYRGLKKTAKYYISQTNELFYKKIPKEAVKSIIFGSIDNIIKGRITN